MVPWVGLQCVLVVYPDHTLLFLCFYTGIVFLMVLERTGSQDYCDTPKMPNCIENNQAIFL